MINKNPQGRPKLLTGNNQLTITVNPFENFFKFTIFKNENDEVLKHNLNDFTNLKMTVKSEKKDLDFKVFRESSENDFENGVAVFRIPESSYKDLKQISEKTDVFYINGEDVFGNRQIIYTGFFKTWDSKQNVSRLESTFSESNRNTSSIKVQNRGRDDKQNQVKDALNNNTSKDKSTNTSADSITDQKRNEFTDLENFRPRYRATDLALSIAIAPSQNEKQQYRELNTKDATLFINYLASAGFLRNTITNEFLNYAEAYFKGLDIFPNSTVIDNWSAQKILLDDLRRYTDLKLFKKEALITGEFQPLTDKQKFYFRKANVPKFLKSPISSPRGSGQSTSSFQNTSQTQKPSQSNSSQQAKPTSGTSTTPINNNNSSEIQFFGYISGIVGGGKPPVPLPRIQIKIASLPQNEISYSKTVVTQDNGYFSFGNLSKFPGTFTLRVNGGNLYESAFLTFTYEEMKKQLQNQSTDGGWKYGLNQK